MATGVVPKDFSRDMLKMGIVSYDEQEKLWHIAKRCASTTGVTVAVPTALATSAVGSVSIPVVGAVPGWVAGALAGFVGGTASCMVANSAFRTQLRLLLNRFESGQDGADQE